MRILLINNIISNISKHSLCSVINVERLIQKTKWNDSLISCISSLNYQKLQATQRSRIQLLLFIGLSVTRWQCQYMQKSTRKADPQQGLKNTLFCPARDNDIDYAKMGRLKRSLISH